MEEREAHGAAVRAERVVERVASRVELGEGAPRVDEEAAAGLGEAQRPALAAEQRAAELRLEAAQRTRQRGLADVDGLRGAGHVLALGHRHEVPQLLRSHVVSV